MCTIRYGSVRLEILMGYSLAISHAYMIMVKVYVVCLYRKETGPSRTFSWTQLQNMYMFVSLA